MDSISRIFCIGRNYVKHIEELKNEKPESPVVFMKPPTAVLPPGKDIHFPAHGNDLHHEAELVLMIGKKGRAEDQPGAMDMIGGYTFGLDLTLRDVQSKMKEKGLPWERAKAFDGSAVFSKFVEISEVTTEMSFELKKNGNTVQTGHMELMMHEPQEILSEILTFMSLIDGDIVMTGTPKGVGKIDKGDVFSAIVRNNEKIVIEETWIAT